MGETNLYVVSATTNASGAYSTTLSIPCGKLLQFRYVPDGSSPLDTGAGITLTGATSGYVYINESSIGTSAYQHAPRQPTYDDTGTALLYAASGTAVSDYFYTAGENLTFAVASGGNAKSGTFYIWFGE